MLEALFICGTWDDKGGSPSGYMHKLYIELKDFYNIKMFNGGYFEDLENIIYAVKDVSVVFWFPNVSNDKEKIVDRIKNVNNKVLLVTSKRNDDNKYSDLLLVSKALKTKSNLFLELIKEDKIYGRLLDPLANVICPKTNNINDIARLLISRLYELQSFTRVKTRQETWNHGNSIDDNHVVFIEDVKILGNRFHDLIHADTSRLLGNCSFRCESGFPSYRNGSSIYVSKRNIDKREINKDSFVRVILNGYHDDVVIDGSIKPSVDTPIQKAMYKFYNNINFMLHSHVYIEDALMTSKIIPCGAIEEFYEILKFIPKETNNFAINLLGHGCLIGSSTYDKGDYLKYNFINRS